MKTDVYNQRGEKTGGIELPDNIFSTPWNDDLVHQVVVSMQANKRTPVAHTKGRGEVSGGGRKPWRQKGLGRARHGSIRSPIWKGGGVSHGPVKEKNYYRKINAKMKKKAFCAVLSQKLRDGEILFLDAITLNRPKTKEAIGVMNSLSKIKGFEKITLKKKNKVIMALDKSNPEISRSFRNIPGTFISPVSNLNLLDILNHKYLVILNPEKSLADWKA